MGFHSNSYKMFLAASITAVVVSSAVLPLHTDAKQMAFKDVKAGHDYYKAIQSLSSRGIINGFANGEFKPNQIVTRGQAAKILAHALGLDSSHVSDPGFSDIKKTNSYYGPIAALIQKGVFNGYSKDHTFRPNDPLTRSQLAKVLTLGYGFKQENSFKYSYKDVNRNSNFSKYVYPLVEKKIMVGRSSNYFDLTSYVTRGQMVDLIYKSELYQKQNGQFITAIISNVTNTTITTDKGTFTLSGSVKNLFNVENKSALINASVKLSVKDHKVEKVEALQLNTSNTVFDANNYVFNGDVTINADHVIFKNSELKGSLLITSKVKTFLNTENLIIHGEIKNINIVASASSESVYKKLSYISTAVNNQVIKSNVKLMLTMNNVSVSRLDIAMDIQLETTGTTKIQEVHLSESADIKADESSSIGTIHVNNGAGNVNINARVLLLYVHSAQGVIINGGGSIEKLQIDGTGKVSINTTGSMGEIQITNPNSQIFLSKDSMIESIKLPAGQKPENIILNYEDFKDVLENSGLQDSYVFGKHPNGSDSDAIAKSIATTSLSHKIDEAIHELTSHSEGTSVGQASQLDRDELSSVINAAQEVLDNRSNKTVQELNNSVTTLQTAITKFKGKVIVAGDATALKTKIGEANQLLLDYTVGIGVGQVSQAVHDALTGAITAASEKVHGTQIEIDDAYSTLDITVNSFENAIIKAVENHSYTSKEITNFDYGTVYATQAKLVSKPINNTNFKNSPKTFTITVDNDTVTVNLNTDLYVPPGITAVEQIRLMVDAAIQDYFFKPGAIKPMTMMATYWGSGDTFNLSTASTGSNARLTLDGHDWNYFFESQVAQGTNQDSSKNREFTVSDGANQITVVLNRIYNSLDDLVTAIDSQLYYGNIRAEAEKIDNSHFRINALDPDKQLIISGINKGDFFE